MKQFVASIIANRSIAAEWRELSLEWDPDAGRPQPGQFFSFRASRASDPLLRRPLAFASVSADSARVRAIYQVRGLATQLLSEEAPGSGLDILGPLGRPFTLPERATQPRSLLVAGGIGIGPILFLHSEIGPPRPSLVLGFRSAALIPELDFPEGSVICTDDGTRGFHGSVVRWLEELAPAEARLFGCGPAPMLAALAALSRRRGWHASLSAEQWMACGVCACMGCALPRADGAGYVRVCADGPVFEYPSPDGLDVDWLRLGTVP